MLSKQKVITENTIIAENILIKIFRHTTIGTTLRELYQIANGDIKKNNAVPSAHVLGYKNFPMSIAINERVFFDKESKTIKNGDLVKLGLGLFKNGYFTDLGFSFIVYKNQKDKNIFFSKNGKLIRGTAKALVEGANNAVGGVTIDKISNKIESVLNNFNLRPVSTITGHGIGKKLHEQPVIPNTGDLPFINYSYRLRQGEIICIEPIATMGSGKVKNINKSSYDIITSDKEPVAHYETPILIGAKRSGVLAPHLFGIIKNIAEGKDYF